MIKSNQTTQCIENSTNPCHGLCTGTADLFCCLGSRQRIDAGSSRNTRALGAFPDYWRDWRNCERLIKGGNNQEGHNMHLRAAVLYHWCKDSQLLKEQEKCSSPHKPSTNQQDWEEAPRGQTVGGQPWSPHQHRAQALFGASRDVSVFPAQLHSPGQGHIRWG